MKGPYPPTPPAYPALMRKYEQMSSCVKQDVDFELHLHKITYEGYINCPGSTKGFIRINYDEWLELESKVRFPARMGDIEPVLRNFYEQHQANSQVPNQ